MRIGKTVAATAVVVGLIGALVGVLPVEASPRTGDAALAGTSELDAGLSPNLLSLYYPDGWFADGSRTISYTDANAAFWHACPCDSSTIRAEVGYTDTQANDLYRVRFLTFQAPLGQTLQAGSFSAPGTGPTPEHGSMEIVGEGANGNTGSFGIESLTMDSSGVPLSFTLTFQLQSGASPVVSGVLRYNSTTPVPDLAGPGISPDFGRQTVGVASGPKTLTFASSGDVAVALGSLSMTGPDAGDFLLSNDTCGNRDLDVGASCTVDVAFEPSDTVQRTAYLAIPYDLNLPPRLVALSGWGTIPTKTTVESIESNDTYYQPGLAFKIAISPNPFNPNPGTNQAEVDCTLDGIGIRSTTVTSDGTATCYGPRSVGSHTLVAALPIYSYFESSSTSFQFDDSVPAKPSSVTAIRGNRSAVVSWNGPASNVGSDVSVYTVTSAPEGKTCGWTGVPLSCTVTGLTNGTAYIFTVTATNEVGTSDPSDPSNYVTPAAVPDAPSGVSGVGFDSSILVRWAFPADNGSAITSYTATASPGGRTCVGTGFFGCTISGLLNHTAYTIAVTATNGAGTGPAGFMAGSVTPRIGASYVPLEPSRILAGRAVTAGIPYTVQVTGIFPLDASRNVPANASAVTGFLSVTNTSSAGWVALTPEPNATATISTINFPGGGDSRSTGVTAPLGSGGQLSVTFGSANVAGVVSVSIDITGYFLQGTSGATYVALTPNRLADSRVGSGITSGAVRSNVPVTFQVTGRTPGVSATNVPANAVAVTGTLTVTGMVSSFGQYSSGIITLTTAPDRQVHSVSMYVHKGDTQATGVTVKLGVGGTLSVTFMGSDPGAKIHVVFDVTGYFAPGGSGAMYVPVVPNRLVDSRIKLGLSTALGACLGKVFQVTGRIPSDATRNIPAGAVAVTGTLTVTGQSALGWLALTPTPNNHPTTSNLNFPKGDNRATGVTVPLDPGGKLSVTYGAVKGASTQVVFDVTGYFVN